MSKYMSSNEVRYPPICYSTNDGRYMNFNLNSQKVHNQSTVQKFSVDKSSDSINDRKNNIYYDPLEKRMKEFYNPWDNKKEKDSWLKNLHLNGAEKDKGSKSWDKKKEYPGSNTSTLNLHIAAYEHENPVKAENVNITSIEKSTKLKGKQHWKKVFTCSSSKNTDVFEIPRQQPQQSSLPDVMQFKASQKLLNPNPQQPLSLFIDQKKKADDQNVKPNSKIKDTKRKDGWDDPAVSTMIDNYILKKYPSKKSKLIEMLQPYFGKVGRSTVIHHINAREKELKKGKPTLKSQKITKYINKKEKKDKCDTVKKPLIEQSAAETAMECAPPEAEDANDPCTLLNQQIDNIQQQLLQPQTSEYLTALEVLLKRLIDAKEEYLHKKLIPSLERDYNVDLSLDSPAAPSVKFKVPRGKMMKLREFSLETTHNQTSYYICVRCRSHSEYHLKHLPGEPPKKCRATVMPNGEVFVDVYHAKTCGAIPKSSSDTWQARKIASLQAANGVKTKAAFDTGFKHALEKKVFSIYGNYTSRLNNLSRWRGKNIPDCFKGNMKQHYQSLYGLNRRWLLEDADNVVVFATDKQLMAMAGAIVVAVDSTFAITPGGFTQTFFCHSLIESDEGEHWVVTAMALMASKDEKELGVEPKFERIHADYEEAQANALKTAFGEDKVNGCLFHYDQCLLRYIGERGLYPYYAQKKSGNKLPENCRRIRTWIRSLMALPLLPKHDCQELAKLLCRPPPKPENVNENEWPTVALQEVADYVIKEWVSRKDRMWNFNNLRRVRNTNRCEGYNGALGKMLDKKPKLKIFLKDMQLLSTEIEAEIEGIEQNRQKAYRSKKYAWLDDKLMFYEELFGNDIKEAKTNIEKNLIRFRHCRRVSYLLHEIRNKSCNTVKSEKKSYKPESFKIWKTDLQYIFDKDKDINAWTEWMEAEEDAMISKGEMEDDLDDMVEESFNCADTEDEFDEKDFAKILSSQPLNLENTHNNDLAFFKSDERKSPSPIPKHTAASSNTVYPPQQPKSDSIIKHLKPLIKLTPKLKSNNNDDDGIQVTKVVMKSIKPESRVIRRAVVRNAQVQDVFGNNIPAKLFNFIMPPSTDLTRSDFFIPPALEQLQHYLLLLDLPPELAYNSPLLTSVAVEPEGKSMVTINTMGDGNCGFRSLSTLLTGVQDHHWHIRLKIYEYIAENGHLIYGIRNAEIANEYYARLQYLRNIPPQPVNADLYAGNDDFYALADMLECNIYLYTPNPLPSYAHISPHFKDNIKINGAPTFFLIYLNNNHFEPIVAFR